MSCRICRRSSFCSAMLRGPEDRVDLAMIHVGANCLANGALRLEKGWRSSENSDVEEPRLTSVQDSSTLALPKISQHLPLLSRAGLSKPTPTHTRARTQTQTAHATTPSGSYRRRLHLRCAARPPGPRPAQSVGNALSRLWRAVWVRTTRRTLTGLAGTREAVAIPASTRCFDFQVWAVGRRS